MAFKSISMHQIRQRIGFPSRGYTISETVRLTGMTRNTVRDYKRSIENQGLRLEDVVSMNDEALAAVVQDETVRLHRTFIEAKLLIPSRSARITFIQCYHLCFFPNLG
jgi:hypothetical protein